MNLKCKNKHKKAINEQMKKIDKINAQYQKNAMKAGCFKCSKRGNPRQVPFEKLHLNCKGCQYEKNILPLFNELISLYKKIDEYKANVISKDVFEELSKVNPNIRLNRTKKTGKFNDFFPKFNSLSLDDKLNLAFLIEANDGPITVLD
ncbi:MAG: hypothetical protein K5925_02130 [Bacilli bacterium]|nr:hypothetical protein [Bacilli bacterium]